MTSPTTATWRTKPLARAVRLAGWRMATSGPWRFARGVGVLVALFFTLAVVFLGIKGHGDEVLSVTARAVTWTAWIGGSVVAWWCAGDRAAIDRNEGIADLARIHGIDDKQLAMARGVAATLRVTALVFLVGTPVALTSAAASPSLRDGLLRIAAWSALVPFSVGCGVVAGAVACACGAIAPKRGRSLFAIVVLAPWLLDGLFVGTRGDVGSLPGVLAFLADLVTRIGGGG